MEKVIEQISAKTDLAKVTITSVPDTPGIASELFSLLGEAGFNLETITQVSTSKNVCDVSFTINEKEVDEVVEYLHTKVEHFHVKDVIVNKNIALITIYGEKIAKTPGIAGKIFSNVAKRAVNIENITASLMMISFLVPKNRADEVVDSLKQEFA
jgi:aspartate kinase